MADDTNLQVGVVIDTSGLTTGTQQVQSAVDRMANTITDRFGTAAKAPDALQSALKSTAQAAVAATSSIEGIGFAAEAAGALIEAAFPVAILAAFVGAMAALASHIETVNEGIRKQVSEDADLAFSAARSAEAIELQNAKLEEQIAKLEGRPTGQTKLEAALIATQLRADKLSESLQTDIDKSVTLLDTGFFKSLFSSFSVDETSIQKQIQPFLNAVDLAKNKVAEAKPGSDDFKNALNEQREAWVNLRDDIVQWEKAVDPTAVDTIAKLNSSLKIANDAIRSLDDSSKQTKLEVQVGDDTNAKEFAEKLKEVNRETLEESREDAREELEQIDRTNAEKKKTYAEGMQYSLEAAREELEQIHEASAARKKAMEETEKLNRDELTSTVEAAKLATESKTSQYATELKLGQINAQQEIALRRSAIEEEANAKEAALNQALSKVDERDPNSPAQRKAIYDQLLRVQEQYSKDSQTLDEQSALALKQEWDQVFSAVNQPLESFVRSVIRGNKTIGQDFRDLGIGVLESITEMLEKTALKVGENLLLQNVLEKSAMAQRLADFATGNAAKQTLQTSSNVATVTGEAGAGAAAAFASVMEALPFPVNIAAAPAVAAATLAQIESFGSLSAFKDGGLVPSDMIALLHEDEMVLPAPLSQKVQQAMSPGSGGGNLNIHIHAMDAQSFSRSGIMKQIKKELSNHARNIGLVRK